MKKIFTVHVVTPEKKLFEQEVLWATVPVLDGEVTLLPDHEAYIGACRTGEVVLQTSDGTKEVFVLSGGFIEFHDNILTVLADTGENVADIDLARAEAGRKRAMEIMENPAEMDEESYARIQAMLERETARIKTAHKWKSHPQVKLGQNTKEE